MKKKKRKQGKFTAEQLVNVSHALAEAQNILSTEESSTHGPRTVLCSECRAFWLGVLDSVNYPGLKSNLELVNELAALIPRGRKHPKVACCPCEGCRLELDLAMAGVALGTVGVDPLLSWGPMHDASSLHDADAWRDCDACVEWKQSRKKARKALKLSGLEPDRWLGSNDKPMRP